MPFSVSERHGHVRAGAVRVDLPVAVDVTLDEAVDRERAHGRRVRPRVDPVHGQVAGEAVERGLVELGVGHVAAADHAPHAHPHARCECHEGFGDSHAAQPSQLAYRKTQ
jgi:hypothetical protein